MICKDSVKPKDYKRVPQGISVLHNRPRKGANAYTKMPKSTSVDWLVASRRVEPVELHNSTASGGTKKKGGVATWLTEVWSLIERLHSLH